MADNGEAAQITTRFQLYGCWRSTCTHRATLALRFHDADFDYHPIDLTAREQESPEFLAISPDAQVPVLVFGDSVLTQSLAIVSLIESLAKETALTSAIVGCSQWTRKTGRAPLPSRERVSSYIQPMTLPAIRRSIRHFPRRVTPVLTSGRRVLSTPC